MNNQNQSITGTGAAIKKALHESGLDHANALMIKVADGLCVVHKKQLTALEVANLANLLFTMGTDLVDHLAAVCGDCNGCGELDEQDAHRAAAYVNGCELCQALLNREQDIQLPAQLLEDAGIPQNAKLTGMVDQNAGEVTVFEADVQADITDVPQSVLMILASAGVCLAELDERIMLEEIVYGEE